MSNDTFVMSVRQANELDHAFSRHGYKPADVKKLSTGDVLADVLEVLRLRSEIQPIDPDAHLIIDLDADPRLVNGATVEEHQRDGLWKFDIKQIKFFLSDTQREGGALDGKKLRKELEDKRVMNANVLDFLLANPHLIPEKWKHDSANTLRIFFWGTIYRSARNSYGSSLFVRYLEWNGFIWLSSERWLDTTIFPWNRFDPAAMRTG